MRDDGIGENKAREMVKVTTLINIKEPHMNGKRGEG